MKKSIWTRLVGMMMALMLVASLPFGAFASEAKDSINIVTYTEPTGVYPLHVDYGADKTRDGIFFQQVYGTLFRYDENNEPTYWIATDYDISEDGLEWTFTLRDDVYFHDGTKMTAEDVVEVLSVDLIGVVPYDEKIVVSTNTGTPLAGDDTLVGQSYMNISKRIMGEDVPFLNLESKKGFLAKLGELFKG